MLEKMRKILNERIHVADRNPFFCPTCNQPRYSKDVILAETGCTLACRDCAASVCAIVEGPENTFLLNEPIMPPENNM